MSSQTVAKFLHETKFKGLLVAHGLRSVGRTWMADHGGTFEASETCLAHVVGSSTSRTYQRSDYLDQRTDLMKAWIAYIADCAQRAQFLSDLFSPTKA